LIYAVVSFLLLVCIGIFMFDEKLSGAESTGSSWPSWPSSCLPG
jgi:hypothetical protein